ncbi:MAG TPA: TonB-dependent receptor [Longimicrobiales bacterium]
MRLRLQILAAAFALLAAIPTSLEAQEPGDTLFRLEELVVTATRLPVRRDASPAAVTVIDGDQLRARGARTVAEALRSVPGAAIVQTGSFGGTTSLFLRGGESDYVKVLIDGVPINDAGGAIDFANLTADNIERIEIVRGPASVLYGSDAVTGVVQIFTRQGTSTTRANASVRTGTYGSLAYGAEASGGNGTARYSVSAHRFTTDGIYDFNNEYRNTTLSGLFRFTPGARSDASLSVRYTDGEFHYPTDGAGRLVDRNQFQREKRLALALDAGHAFTSRLEGRLLLTTHRLDRTIDDRPDDDTDPESSLTRTNGTRAAADARLNLRLSPTTTISAGAELAVQQEDQWSEFAGPWGSSRDSSDVRRTNRAYYAQALADLGGRLALHLGTRLEDNELFGTFLTYRAGATYRLASGTRLRAAAGTAFKEPTFFENFAQGFAKGNPNLEPERSRSWELGVEQALFDGRLSLAATYFDQRFRDLIQYTATPPQPDAPNYFNIAGADAAGVEAEARLLLTPGLTVAASYTRLSTEITDAGYDASLQPGDRLLRRPTHTANLSLGYRLADRGSLDLALHYTGERDDLDFSEFPSRRVTLDAYTRLDLAFAYDILPARASRPGLTATLQVENAFDASYQEVANFPARGRTIFVGARVGLGSGPDR